MANNNNGDGGPPAFQINPDTVAEAVADIAAATATATVQGMY